MMNEFENGELTLATTLLDMFPSKQLNDKAYLTIKEMFSHNSGLFPWIPFYKKTIDSITNKPLSNWFTSSKIDKLPIIYF